MTRALVRSLKRTVRDACSPAPRAAEPQEARSAALMLLSRSVRFGHGRLAVIRLQQAVEAGAEVPQAHWLYCSRAAHASDDVRLQSLYRAAAVRATQA